MCRRRENVVIGFNLETLKEKFEQASVDSYPAGVHWNNFNDWIFCKNRKCMMTSLKRHEMSLDSFITSDEKCGE